MAEAECTSVSYTHLELIMGGKNGLEAVEKTLIDRAVISVYRNYLADPKPENMPILGDLYDEIRCV